MEHPGKLRQIGFQPVLLFVPQRRFFQIADHLVDVVFYERDLALRFHLNRTGQIAFCDRGSDIGNGPKLRRQICRQPIYVVGQITPRSRRARHAGLAA